MISAKIVTDTQYADSRLTTFELVYPRMIHSELMTYCVFARNSASTRAIPIEKMIEAVRTTPAMPVFWGKNQKGMVASEELSPEDKDRAIIVWLQGAGRAIETAQELSAIGVHKQIANRIMEPFLHMQTVLTATEWANMYAQRTAKDAQPEFQALAEAMLKAHNASKPKLVTTDGVWHTPYVDDAEFVALGQEDACAVSAARCARVSYTRHGTRGDLQKDLDLFESLTKRGHWSPLEHIAVSAHGCDVGKFKRFQQLRHQYLGENITTFDRLLDPFREEEGAGVLPSNTENEEELYG
jgi:thymidylate synthase ThyX